MGLKREKESGKGSRGEGQAKGGTERQSLCVCLPLVFGVEAALMKGLPS